MTAAQGALEGVRVADFSRVLAAPYATMLLADLGAEVIKVERPDGGDETRHWGPPWVDGEATYFASVNRNKRSVTIDLHTAEGRRTAQELVAGADVVVENFRPGTMKRLGLDYEAVRAVNPGIVYCSVSGFGSAGGAELPGFDLLVQALGGLMSITGQDPAEPTKVGVALVDVVTGLHAGLGILAALRHRENSGQGQQVEVNLMSSLLSALTNQAAAYLGAGVVPKPMGNRHPSIAPYEVFPTADRSLVIAIGNDRQFGTLVRALDVAHLETDPRFATNSARVQHRHELYEILRDVLAGDTADEWFDRLSVKGIPCGPINDISQAFSLGAQLGLQPVVEVKDPLSGTVHRQVANPIRLSETPASYRLPPPRLGQHSQIHEGDGGGPS